jgi:hypothetical protein
MVTSRKSTMGIPTCIYIPSGAEEDGDVSMVSWYSLSGAPISLITDEVSHLRQRSHQKWERSQEGCDHAIKMPHRCDSQAMIESEDDDDADEGSPRGPHTETVDCKRRHRMSLKEETLASCMVRSKLHDEEDEPHEQDRPPRAPRRSTK